MKPWQSGNNTTVFSNLALRAAILKCESFSCFTGERRTKRKGLTRSRRVQPPGGAAQALRFGARSPAPPPQGAALGPECAAGSESGAIGHHAPVTVTENKQDQTHPFTLRYVMLCYDTTCYIM